MTKNARATTTFDHFFTQKLWNKQFGNRLSDYWLLIIGYLGEKGKNFKIIINIFSWQTALLQEEI